MAERFVRTPYTALWLVPLLFALALIAGFSTLAYHDRTTLRATVAERNASVSYFVAEDVRSAFWQYDRTLRSIVEMIETQGVAAALESGAMVRQLAVSRAIGTAITFAAVTDHEGAVLARDTGRPPPGQKPHAHTRDFFIALKADPDRGLVIGAPFTASNSNSSVIGVARAFRTPERRFGGVVVLMVEPGRFDILKSLPTLQEGGAISILRRDGVPLFTTPGRNSDNLSLAGLPALRELVARDAMGSFVATPPDVPDERAVHVRRVEDHPLVVAYAQPLAPLSVAWRETWIRNGILLLVALLGLTTLGVILHRRAARAEAHIEIERRKALAALLESRDMAERASRAKSDFLAMMSHELRTPLNAILGFARLVRDGAKDRPATETASFAAEINNAGEHLLSLINDLLDLHKIEAGRMEIRPEPVLIDRLLRSSSAQITGLAAERGLVLRTEVGDDLPLLWADARAVRQMLFNLLGNACKFTPEGGSVTLSAEALDTGSIVLRVADTGIGMSDAGKRLALEPFGQVDNPANRAERGTGLGLPLVRGLMALHGGQMLIRTAPGQGTTISLVFPPYLHAPRNMQSLADMAKPPPMVRPPALKP